MGRLQLLSLLAIYFFSPVVLAGYSTNQADLERAAELAVERAAEKAAERAVEKALNSGNSSTVTVTVKEAYSNSLKTAEEAAAPGSESTRPYDPNIYNRQYTYKPPADGYKVDDSSEAKELGLSKESVNSSVENLEVTSAEVVEPDKPVVASVEDTEGMNFESVKDADKSLPLPDSATKLEEFGADFSDLDISSEAGDASFKGDFGLKSNTQTFSSSYSKAKDDFPETKIEVDDDEDAEIFKMYASDFGDSGWSSTKKEGWVRHRQLWDDNKHVRVSRGFWDDFGDDSGDDVDEDGDKVEKGSPDTEKTKLHKRMVDPENGKTGHIAVPLATLSLNPKTPAALYQLLKREVKFPLKNGQNQTSIPMKVYITIPMPYSPSYGFQKNIETKPINPKAQELIVPPPEQLNEEINKDGLLVSREPYKRSLNNKTENIALLYDRYRKPLAVRGRTHQLAAKTNLKKFNAQYSNLKNMSKIQ